MRKYICLGLYVFLNNSVSVARSFIPSLSIKNTRKFTNSIIGIFMRKIHSIWQILDNGIGILRLIRIRKTAVDMRINDHYFTKMFFFNPVCPLLGPPTIGYYDR
uniref:Uncharacterized protein n=1 Tax=Saccharomyces cerevisiae TaxID=4932 RepID=E9PAE2_YEASX|nr:putative protein [Saccharomyces cerevisiae]